MVAARQTLQLGDHDHVGIVCLGNLPAEVNAFLGNADQLCSKIPPLEDMSTDSRSQLLGQAIQGGAGNLNVVLFDVGKNWQHADLVNQPRQGGLVGTQLGEVLGQDMAD